MSGDPTLFADLVEEWKLPETTTSFTLTCYPGFASLVVHSLVPLDDAEITPVLRELKASTPVRTVHDVGRKESE